MAKIKIESLKPKAKPKWKSQKVGIRTIRGNGTISFQHIYNTNRWKKLREEKMKLNPLCEHCSQPHDPVIATVVDHICPLLVNEGLAYEADNLQSLCDSCHRTKTEADKVNYPEYKNYDLLYTKNEPQGEDENEPYFP